MPIALKTAVLIESDWNLKDDKNYVKNYATTVLIESDWNLKRIATNTNISADVVLIESDWNLKFLIFRIFLVTGS